MRTPRQTHLCVWLPFILSALACDAPRMPKSAVPNTAPGVSSPAETARQLWEAHQRYDYDAIAARVVPSEREHFVKTLRAIDEVILANQTLQQTAEQCYRGPIAETWSLDAMRNNLGVFSRNVTFFNQTFRGDEAEVTIQEGDNIPLLHVSFVYHDGRWLHRPEPAPRALAHEMQRLASALWRLCDRVKAGATIEEFAVTFRLEVEPRIVRAMTVTDVDVTVATGQTDAEAGNVGP